jgi:hypothetical protein
MICLKLEYFKIGEDWRPIYSNIAKKTIKNDYKQFDWNLPLDKLICKPDASKNKYKVPASLSLEEWEQYGWILPTDNISSYRGWIAWYCLYYSGERNPEIDTKQIKRWLSVKRRFGKIPNKSDKIKQLLLNWAIGCYSQMLIK